MGRFEWTLDPAFRASNAAAAAASDASASSAPPQPQPRARWRLGALATSGTWDATAPSVFETPMLLSRTRRGEHPHLMPDIMDLLPAEARAFQVSLGHFLDRLGPDHVGNHPNGGRAYFGVRPTCVVLSPRDPIAFETNARNANDDGVFVAGPDGTKPLTVAEYARWIKALQVDAYVSLPDERPCVEVEEVDDDADADAAAAAAAAETARKKVVTAVKRTERWLEACLGADVGGAACLASVQGGSDLALRAEAARNAAARGDAVAGFSIGGLGAGESPGPTRDALIAAVISQLPEDKPRHITGVSTPLDVIRLVELGVDIMDGAFAHQCTENGYGLCFPLAPKRADGEKEFEPMHAMNEHPDATRHSHQSEFVEETDKDRAIQGGDAWKINLLSLAFKLDARPILPGCDCFTCANHHRAYIHHLLQCHEMTAQILIDAHNAHQYCRFFRAMRRAMREGTFEAFAAFHRDRARRVAGGG